MNFAKEFHLVDCSSISKPVGIDYTYHCLTTGSRSWIDFFLVSSDLGQNLVDLDILEDPLNLSDHNCIVIKMNINTTELSVPSNPTVVNKTSKAPVRYRWDHANIYEYYEATRVSCQTILDEFRPMYDKIMNPRVVPCLNNICRSKHNTTDVTDMSITNATSIYLIDKYYGMTVDQC